MGRPSRLLSVFALLIIIMCNVGRADVLKLPETVVVTPSNNANETSFAIEMPARGMSMSLVEAHFGEPQQKTPKVGEPPITRWEYGRFTVYFEHNYVLHSVVHKLSLQTTEPQQPSAQSN